MQFSIIIPTFARPERLGQCMVGLAALDYPRDRFEVIVVDDGSPVSVEPIMRRFNGLLNVTLLRKTNQGPGPARNSGAAQAQGQLLAFLDDDCVPGPHWLSHLALANARCPEAMLVGATTNGCSENVFAEVNHVLVRAVTTWLRDNKSPLMFFPTNNLCIPAEAFHEIAGFCPQIRISAGEDRELCARWVASGRQILEVSDAGIEHYHPQTPGSFLRMHWRYGRGAAMLHRACKTNPIQFVTKGLYSNLLRAGVRTRPQHSRAEMVVMLLVTQFASAAGYFFEVIRSRTAPRADWPRTSLREEVVKVMQSAVQGRMQE